MPIPEQDTNGLLPDGIFDCTLEEIRRRFGQFQGSDRRVELFGRLDVLISAMRQSELFEELLVDGSFVTGKAAPNDIDIIAVLGTEANFERELTMFE